MKSENYRYRIRRIVQASLFILTFSIILWEFTPYKTWFAGMILGITTGTLSSIHIAWKVHRVAEKAIHTEGKQRRANLGTFTRYSLAILATVVALQYPHLFSMPGVATGLLLPIFLAYVDAIYLNMKKI